MHSTVKSQRVTVYLSLSYRWFAEGRGSTPESNHGTLKVTGSNRYRGESFLLMRLLEGIRDVRVREATAESGVFVGSVFHYDGPFVVYVWLDWCHLNLLLALTCWLTYTLITWHFMFTSLVNLIVYAAVVRDVSLILLQSKKQNHNTTE